MATETLSSDHRTAIEQVEKEVHEEVKIMEEDSPSPMVSSAESVGKSDEEEKQKEEEPAKTNIEEIKKADEEKKPTIIGEELRKTDEEMEPKVEDVKKIDEDEMPKAEQSPPAPTSTTTEEVNKHVETLALDDAGEEVLVLLNKESEAQSTPEQAVDVVNGESETEKVEIPQKEFEKGLHDQPTTVEVKKEQVEELHANQPEKEEQKKEHIPDSVPIVEDKLAEQPEVTEKFEQEPAENKTEIPKQEETEAPLKEEVGKVEENETKEVKTDQEEKEKKNVVTEELVLPESKESELSEKAPEVEIASRGIAENGSNKDETNITTEVEKKVTEKLVEPKLELETAKTDAAKDGEERKTLEEAFKEEVLPKTKQSNNLISKMKQSLVKAKKAIIGKSPSTKSEAKN